jgi:hypothetical protein
MMRFRRFVVVMLAQVIGAALYGGAYALELFKGVGLLTVMGAGQFMGFCLALVWLLAKDAKTGDGPDRGDDDPPPDPAPSEPPGDMLWWYDVATAWQNAPPPSRRERVRRLILESEFGRKLP